MLAEQMRAMGVHVADLTTTFIDNLYQTSALHDIGKVGIPDAILLKPCKLTPEEFMEMKKHSAIGANTLAAVLELYPRTRFLRMGVDVARSHHEKWDGSGYPDKLKAAEIPLAARIVAAADFYDAVTSKRCYRPATNHEDTCRMIQESSGTRFDPDVVAAFSSLDSQFRHARHAMQN
jgi:putative two-component system response regulator